MTDIKHTEHTKFNIPGILWILIGAGVGASMSDSGLGLAIGLVFGLVLALIWNRIN